MTDEPAGPDLAGRRGPTLSSLVGAGFALWGVLIGIQALHDNSFLTHLAAGRLILRDHHIPVSDPFSFTAHGEPWTVQSWLPSLAYAWAEKLDGLGGIRVLQAVLVGAVALVVWRLTAPAVSVLARVLIAAMVMVIGTGLWVERPLVVGLLCLGLVILLVQGERDLRWLLPIMWIWVNSHGSFPLGLAYLVLLAIGTRLDGTRPARELTALGWAVAGTLLGALNPLGVRLLVFPVAVLQKSQSFAVIQEWKPPRFDNPWQIMFVVEVLVAVALLVRARRWRLAVPAAAFVALSCTSARHIVPTSLILVPAIATAAAGLGSIDGAVRPRFGRAAFGAVIVVGLLLSVSSLGGPDTRLDAYPEQAVTWLDQHDLLHDRLVAPDFVGNYIEARYLDAVPVFVDDRVDMYPGAVIRDEVVLLHARPGWPEVLRRNRAGVVLWQRDKPLTAALRASGRWTVVWSDAKWVVFVPDGHAS